MKRRREGNSAIRAIRLLPDRRTVSLVFPVATACLFFGSGIGAAAGHETPSPSPNILLLVAEDLSPHLGSYGDPIARTPNLDALAREGIRFSRVFTTAPVCAPSRAALITGVHQNAIGAQHMRTSNAPGGGYRSVPPPEVKAFPELLRAAGYYTFTDGKLDYQFSGPLAGSGPFTIWDAEGNGSSWRERAEGQPFFGLINFQATHESGTFAPLGEWPSSLMHLVLQLVRVATIGFAPAELSPEPESLVLPPYYPDRPAVRRELARHYGNIAFMDRQVGEIFAALDADGLRRETIVIFTTDHGDGLPRAKRDLFDGGIRVPMIVRPRGTPTHPDPVGDADTAPAITGSTDERLVSFVDLAPTILALAGLEQPAWMTGRDLFEPSLPPRAYVFAARDRMDEVPNRQRAVRDARWKYIRSDHPGIPNGHPLAFRDNQAMTREMRAAFEAGSLDATQARWFEPVGAEQLYDTASDPFEIHDLSANPEHAAELARLRAALDEWLEAIGDVREVDEATLVERIHCEGNPCTTPPPTLRRRDDRIEIRSEITAASIGYRWDGGPWRLYSRPIRSSEGGRLEAKAVRYGWDESDSVVLTVPEP